MKNLFWKFVRYKLVSDPWFEGFGWTLTWFQTQTRIWKFLQNVFKKEFYKKEKKCDVYSHPDLNGKWFPEIFILVIDMLICVLLEMYASK